ncbi:MAG: 2-amino-4-hydroxy-6-hydroxymethyldihydropteridine diphosphokinase [Magnetococcales bacterium]|nr:2-amino-4-hydroxy-6-hydroxymethyldihydropteridine diphosphokinase [Magnetococcales bacterium]
MGLGSNRGDAVAHCRRGCAALAESAGVRGLECSPFYRSQPWGEAAQPPFVNAVLRLSTSLEPLALLLRLWQVERREGRRREVERRWGPRSLDLDLLFFGNRILSLPGLSVPHPRLHLRRFVLRPLADLSPGLIHPLFGKTVDSLLAAVDDLGWVEPLSSVPHWRSSPGDGVDCPQGGGDRRRD